MRLLGIKTLRWKVGDECGVVGVVVVVGSCDGGGGDGKSGAGRILERIGALPGRVGGGGGTVGGEGAVALLLGYSSMPEVVVVMVEEEEVHGGMGV